MADEAKLGTPWVAAELDEIVADYFAMLNAEISGQPYSKSAHSKALMVRIGRTHRSVEFKHQNISAVLDELGLPWIRGYIPKRNYQGAIFDAIERYLTGSPEILDRTPDAGLPSAPASAIFVPAPVPDVAAIPFRSVFGSWFASSTQLKETTEIVRSAGQARSLCLIWNRGA